MIFNKVSFVLATLATSVQSFGVVVNTSTGRYGKTSKTGISNSLTASYPSSLTTTCLFADTPEASNNEEVDNGDGGGAAGTGEGSEGGVDETLDVGSASSTTTGSAEMDILNSPAFLKRKVEVLKSDIEATIKETEEAQARAEAGKAEWGPQLEALRKEYQNIQERMAGQSETRDIEVVRSVVREMLDLLDNFDRAFGVIKAENEAEQVIEGEYRESYQMVMDVIASLGVEEVPTVGIEFDYELHQAVMQKPGTDYEEGIVCEEFQKGFILGDKLIRAAMVAVAV